MTIPTIKFGTDGWRGVIGDDFTFEAVRAVAQGIADYVRDRGGDRLVVGYDCRFASEVFADDVARVLAANRVRALLVDRASPTQVASWTVIDRGASGAAVVTASHNPYLFNGVKYKPETGSSAPSDVVGELEQRINGVAGRRLEVHRADPDDPLIERFDPRPSYQAQVARMVDLERMRSAGIRILHECMHGSGAGYVRELLGGGATKVTELHAERNPFFGGVSPEPIPPNLRPALDTMGEGGFDLCICTDGDADRVGILDEHGRFVNQLQVYALLLRYLVEVRGWKGPIVKSINMTSMADRLAARYEIPVHEVPVGFKFIAPRMMETGALLGGEESGGYAIRGHIPERDGIVIGLFLADLVVRTGQALSTQLAELERLVGPHAYGRHDIHLPRETYERDRQRVLTTLRDHAPAVVAGEKVAAVRDDDGFKFTLDDGSWVLLRASGTEALVRVYSEAASEEAVEARLHALEEIVGIRSDGRVG
ncbi:MAG: phosphoglucomutase/phosphomannomutase family protein [Candidatus Dormibacteraeota bacterium]|nr:phosphoglucomutase/phosphomannomutase family protein [Candidatus Dormibacteraeota bacterium]MBO0704085.1 phosphoglucomutase/phosphomannomutase family protein [Candidatus Dormibacteraeota bacterium]MBO0760635.1 phosphoglucomutase/phosphomannomutase family protein [Candidatus Dormibacteraeota bacterium]